MAIIYSTHDIAPQERFDYWRDATGSAYGLTRTRELSADQFDGSLDVQIKGGISYSRIKSRPIEYQSIQPDNEGLFISLSLCSVAQLEQNGKTSLQGPGDVVIYDATLPYTYTFPEGDDQIVLVVPRAALQLHLPRLDNFLSRTLKSNSPLGSLINSMLIEIWNAQELSETRGERLNGSFFDVLANAYEAAFIDDDSARLDSRRTRLLGNIKNFLLANLDSAGLTLEGIAAGTHTSTRTVNRLFAAEGTTAVRWLWEQRLSACHQALATGRFSQVSEAALSYGFTNLSHFSRAFKKAFGIPPHHLLR